GAGAGKAGWECRRSRKSGAVGPADEPDQTPSPAADLISDGGNPRPPRSSGGSHLRPHWRDTFGHAQALSRADRRICGYRTIVSLHEARRSMGQSLSIGGSARKGRRPWHHASQLQLGNSFFLYQCAGPDLGRAGEGDRDRDSAISARAGSSRSTITQSNIPAPQKRYLSASAPL